MIRRFLWVASAVVSGILLYVAALVITHALLAIH